MVKIVLIIFFLFSFVMLPKVLLYADRDCTRTVVCSDGTKYITTECTSSYSIIDGRIVDDDSDGPDGPKHGHHHDGGYVDPCGLRHGPEPEPNAVIGNEAGSDDPYGLRHGHPRAYDPDDPYGLRQHQQTANEALTQ